MFFYPFCFDDLQEVDATTGNDLALHLDGQTEHVDVEKSDGGESRCSQSYSVQVETLEMLNIGSIVCLFFVSSPVIDEIHLNLTVETGPPPGHSRGNS